MVYYNSIKKEFKAIAEQQGNVVDGQNVDYKGRYRFNISDTAAKRSKKSHIYLIIFCTLAVLIALLAFINDPSENNPYIIWSLVLFFGALDIFLILDIKKAKNSIKTSFIQYENGHFKYNNGRGKLFNFKLKDIDRIIFNTYGRTNRWYLMLYINNSDKYLSFHLDILMYSNPKLIFALLLGDNKSTHVNF